MDKQDVRYLTALTRLAAKHPRFHLDAFRFTADAVTHTVRLLKKERAPTDERQISGQELLDGFRRLALEQYGPLTRDVLADWGLNRTEDVGEIVFLMVENRLLGASERDSRSDFEAGYDFDDAFVKPFEPDPAAPAPKPEPLV